MNNIRIKYCFEYSIDEMKTYFKRLREISSHPVLLNRTDEDMIREWCAHKLLYKLGLFRKHTRDVDLEFPQKWYIRTLYYIFGSIAKIILK